MVGAYAYFAGSGCMKDAVAYPRQVTCIIIFVFHRKAPAFGIAVGSVSSYRSPFSVGRTTPGLDLEGIDMVNYDTVEGLLVMRYECAALAEKNLLTVF